ncbi:hypothetical protein PUR61_07350, partial [Streptomyces sp. BE20]|uniref:hypothetical protein n=1 Tax=Streptomyces sp. BE20 TaxID=3002525 RepID=UPI002E7A2676
GPVPTGTVLPSDLIGHALIGLGVVASPDAGRADAERARPVLDPDGRASPAPLTHPGAELTHTPAHPLRNHAAQKHPKQQEQNQRSHAPHVAKRMNQGTNQHQNETQTQAARARSVPWRRGCPDCW